MPLNPRERTIAIAAGSALGLGVLYTAFISPLEDRLDAATTHIREDGDAVRGLAGLQANRNRAAALWKTMSGGTLKNDEATAAGQLLNHVRDVAQSSGLTLDSLKPERSEKEKEFQRITFRAAANGTMRQVKAFLDALRTSAIPLRVNDVQLVSRKDGVDDVAIQAGISTIYEPPAATAKEATR